MGICWYIWVSMGINGYMGIYWYIWVYVCIHGYIAVYWETWTERKIKYIAVINLNIIYHYLLLSIIHSITHIIKGDTAKMSTFKLSGYFVFTVFQL